jgi:hypothetical protein
MANLKSKTFYRAIDPMSSTGQQNKKARGGHREAIQI